MGIVATTSPTWLFSAMVSVVGGEQPAGTEENRFVTNQETLLTQLSKCFTVMTAFCEENRLRTFSETSSGSGSDHSSQF